MNPLTDAQLALKAAVRRAVKLSGGCNAAAASTRVDAARLSRYGNSDTPEFAPIDICMDLDAAAGDYIILCAWADKCGFDLVPRDIDRLAAADIAQVAGQVAKESGEFVAAAIDAVASGLTPAKAKIVDQ